MIVGRFARGMWAGGFVTTTVMGLRQDMMGKDRWLRYVDAAWSDSRWTVVAEIVVMVLLVVWTVWEVRNEIREEASR